MRSYLILGFSLALLLCSCNKETYDCTPDLAAIVGTYEGTIKFCDAPGLDACFVNSILEVEENASAEGLRFTFTCDSAIIIGTDTFDQTIRLPFYPFCQVYEFETPIIFLSQYSYEEIISRDGWFDPSTGDLDIGLTHYRAREFEGYAPEFRGRKRE